MQASNAPANTSSLYTAYCSTLVGVKSTATWALNGLSSAVKTVSHLPSSVFNGIKQRCADKGVLGVAVEVGQICLGGAIFVEMHRLYTQAESRGAWDTAKSIAIILLAIQAYKYSNRLSQLAKKANELSAHVELLGETSARGNAKMDEVAQKLDQVLRMPPQGIMNESSFFYAAEGLNFIQRTGNHPAMGILEAIIQQKTAGGARALDTSLLDRSLPWVSSETVSL